MCVLFHSFRNYKMLLGIRNKHHGWTHKGTENFSRKVIYPLSFFHSPRFFRFHSLSNKGFCGTQSDVHICEPHSDCLVFMPYVSCPTSRAFHLYSFLLLALALFFCAMMIDNKIQYIPKNCAIWHLFCMLMILCTKCWRFSQKFRLVNDDVVF